MVIHYQKLMYLVGDLSWERINRCVTDNATSDNLGMQPNSILFHVNIVY